MEALTNTNAPIAYDPIRFGREIMGLSGQRVKANSPLGKFIADQAKEFNKKRIEALSAGPQAEPRFMSVTNAEGRVIDLLIKPDGEPIVVKPETLNTPKGTYTMQSPTNLVPVMMPDGTVAQNYTAGPMGAFFSGQMGNAPISQYNAQQSPTNVAQAAASAPQQVAPQAAAPNTAVNQVAPPTVAPPPQSAVQGTVRVMSPNGQTGRISVDQLEQALREGYQQIQ